MDLKFSEMLKNLGGMKEHMEQMKAKISRLNVEGEAGAGMVKVKASGEGDITDVKIDPQLLSSGEKDMLEELVISATNDALKKAREAAAREMKSLAGGLNIPGLDKLFGG